MASFPFTVSFWNVRGLRSRVAEVEALSQWVDICGLGESRLCADLEYELPGFSVYRNDAGSGVLLALRHSVPHRHFPITSCQGGVAVAVQVATSKGWVWLWCCM